MGASDGDVPLVLLLLCPPITLLLMFCSCLVSRMRERGLMDLAVDIDVDGAHLFVVIV